MSKMCSGHSHGLMGALRKKGMGSLIRPERAAESAKKWLDGTALKHEFDPYVVASLEILAMCNKMNIYVIEGACPLCTTNAALQNAAAADKWIDNVSDLMLLTAQTNQLVAVGSR